MLRATIKGGILCSIYPFNLIPSGADKPVREPPPQMNTPQELVPGEIAMYRLRKMFKTQDGNLSKEVQSIITTTLSGTVTGCLLGGIVAARNVPEDFIAENTATRFQNQFDAKRQLQNKFTLTFGRGAVKFGLKLGLFCFLYASTSTCTNVYRGKIEVLNYMGAGAVTGALYKMNMGLKGMISGAVLGSTLGGLYGACTVLILYVAGVEMDAIYATQHSWVLAREKASREQIARQMESDMPEARRIYELNESEKLETSHKDKVPQT